MKFGFNLLLWTGHVTQEHSGLIRKIKAAGYDGVEIPVFEGSPDHYARLGDLLDKIGLERTVVSVFGAGKNPLSADFAEQKAAMDYAKWYVDCSVALGAPILGGPMHSQLGYFTGVGATKKEIRRGVIFHRRIGDYAAKKNVRFALEALNRFECYFLNTMEQLANYLDEVDHPAIKGMYDTFHSNIEEKDPVGAINAIKRHLIHVHISENDRGTPGKGHVPWDETFHALRKARYDGWYTIEAFGRAFPALAAATRVWRDYAPSPDEVYLEGLKHMKRGWAKSA